MDPKHAGVMLTHLEKQHELLVDARQSMMDELHKYQIEEEMLMRKLHEVMSAHTKKNNESPQLASDHGEIAECNIREAATTTGGGVKKPITYSRRKKQ